MGTEILAAGGIVIDTGTGTPRILLVHRPRYDDWSFPKGKLDPGETFERAALREVEEETGLVCRIIREVETMRYGYRTPNKGPIKPKVVHYFLMERVSGDIHVPVQEVDQAVWFDIDKAVLKLSYDRDRKLLASLLRSPDTERSMG